mgnify:CR=1 FL=1
MIQTLRNAWKVQELRNKILYTLGMLLLFRLVGVIPAPGVDASRVLTGTATDLPILQLVNMMTGSNFQNMTIMAMGITPYINSSIIMQLLTIAIPALERLQKSGPEGQKKIAQITRYVTVGLAVVQAIGLVASLGYIKSGWFNTVLVGVSMAGGTALAMWIGERITEYGVGNGISMIIFIGILSTAGTTIVGKFETAFTDIPNNLDELGFILLFVVIAVVIFFAIVYVDLAERRIPVQYAKQVRGTKMYGGQSSVIPMKISGSGVMPLIFAYAIISFPSMIMSLVPNWSDELEWWNNNFQNGTYGIWYILVLCVLIFAFSFFYAQIQFNPEDVSRNIQQNGGFIQGIRPGKPTAEYLSRINKRITLFGAIFLTLVAFVPSIAFSWAGNDLVNVFSTTGILIVVSVALEFDKQLQSQILMKNYKGFLK